MKAKYYTYNQRLDYFCNRYGHDANGGEGDEGYNGSTTIPDASNANSIIRRALSISDYVYWYGGAGQYATESLARSLRSAYPEIWTSSYYSKALLDVEYDDDDEPINRVSDCSYFVNYAYGMGSTGNHGPGTSEYPSIFTETSSLKNGYVLWRSGHTGLYYNGQALQFKGIDYDFVAEDYQPGKWSRIYFYPEVNYDD